MYALTVYQPYALAEVAGIKGFETRPNKTNIRGRVAIHAGAKDIMQALKGRSDADFWEIQAILQQSPFIDNVLFRGGVIGTVRITDCISVEEVRDVLTDKERLLGDYSDGRFAWKLENPVLFDWPIPARGQQRFWNWKPPVCYDTITGNVRSFPCNHEKCSVCGACAKVRGQNA